MIPERDLGATPILDIHHLGIDFGGLHAVDDFTLVIGARRLRGSSAPTAGQNHGVQPFNQRLHAYARGHSARRRGYRGKATHQLNKMGIARTFQNIRLFKDLSVEDNVKIGLHNAFTYSLGSALFRFPSYWSSERKAHETALELLSIFDMQSLADQKAGSLPYGAQRRLEIVRALATGPKLLLLDEPAAGMNPSETGELMENIKKIRNTFEIAIMLIEHDMNLVMGICEGISVLNYGKIIAKGTPEQI
jgi:branched-chain amino acid transport system ATP-binding protein